MPNEKTRLYMRTQRSPETPHTRKPVGIWMSGVESVGFVNGSPIVMVRLEDGGYEPLSDLLITEIVERRITMRLFDTPGQSK